MKISHVIETTPYDLLKTEVEHRTTYNLNNCALNIYETHKKVENIHLRFEGFTITSMLRGKKVLHEKDNLIDYIPGESFLLKSDDRMVIDFPEANKSNPTQCTALVIDNSYLDSQLSYINEKFSTDRELDSLWHFAPEHMMLSNNEQISDLSGKLIRLFSSDDPLKDILVDIRLKELMVAIIRAQNLQELSNDNSSGNRVNDRFKAVVEYIRKNITANFSSIELSRMACMSKSVFYRNFTNEFGVPPDQLIINERIRYAKALMMSGNVKIKEVCFASGFSDPNYFSRAFRKVVGMSPGEYLMKLKIN